MYEWFHLLESLIKNVFIIGGIKVAAMETF